MDRCESCARELASEWKFCIYCGKPVSDSQQTSRVTSASSPVTANPPPATPSTSPVIPSAIRPEPDEPPRRKYDAPFWVGVGMGVLGLTLIIYAAVQIYGSYA